MTETQFVEPSSSHSTVMMPSKRSPQKPFNSPVKSWKRFTSAEDSLPQKVSYSPSKTEVLFIICTIIGLFCIHFFLIILEKYFESTDDLSEV